MKPRIRLKHGIWYCGLPGQRNRSFLFPPYGHGLTPAEAYKDWKEQQ